MYNLNKNVKELSPTVLSKLVQAHILGEASRLENLENYYAGDTAITLRTMTDTTKPNNKIVNPFSNYITNTLVGYFMGIPVTYSSEITDLDPLVEILSDNNEQDENAELATDASIYGVAYELCYLNEQGDLRFKNLDPKEIIPIYDDTLEQELLMVIRYYTQYNLETDQTYGIIEVYNNETKTTYKCNDSFGDLSLLGEPFYHYFTEVPIVIYKNNNYMTGDFERVISLIDSYDKVLSDGINDFEAFVNSYLVLKGMSAEAEDITTMRENRVMILDNDADVSWLIKQASEAQSQNLLTQTENNIHKFSHCPNLNDEHFAANASGVAMRYKIMGTEDLALIKERKFKRGLQKRLSLIADILNLKGESIDWKDIDITFYRNLPVSLAEDMGAILQLSGVISHRTQLAQIPFISDIDSELEQLRKERDEAPVFYSSSPLGDDNEAETE